MKESEFGKGLTYCIGLFLMHAERNKTGMTKEFLEDRWPEMWFNGASDHVCELETSIIQDEKLRKEVNAWRDKLLHWGHGFSEPHPKPEDIDWAIEKAKEFLRIIDGELLGIEVIRAQNE